MTILSEAFYTFKEIPIKRSIVFFSAEPGQVIFIVVWKHKRPQIAKTILREKSTAGGTMIPDVKRYYKATVIKTVWYLYKNRHRS